jgi:hypothetical protein
VDKINNPILDTFAQHIIENRLISLSITFCHHNVTEPIEHLLTATVLRRLLYLRLDHTLRAVEYVLRHLTINICIYGEYHIILHCCTHLRALSMRNSIEDRWFLNLLSVQNLPRTDLLDNTQTGNKMAKCY